MKKIFPLRRIDYKERLTVIQSILVFLGLTNTDKKGQALVGAIWGLVGLAIGLVVLSIVNGLGADILSDIRDDQTSNEYDYNATTEGLKGVDKVAGFTTTVATVGVAAMIIMIIISAFGGIMGGRRR